MKTGTVRTSAPIKPQAMEAVSPEMRAKAGAALISAVSQLATIKPEEGDEKRIGQVALRASKILRQRGFNSWAEIYTALTGERVEP